MADHNLIMLSGTQLTECQVEVDDVTGLVTVPTLTPVNPDHLVTKDYVDGLVGGTAATVTDLTTRLANKAEQVDLAAAEGDITTLQTDVAAKADGADLVAVQAALAAKADAADVTTLQADVATLQADVATAQADIAQLQTDVAALTARLTAAGIP